MTATVTPVVPPRASPASAGDASPADGFRPSGLAYGLDRHQPARGALTEGQAENARDCDGLSPKLGREPLGADDADAGATQTATDVGNAVAGPAALATSTAGTSPAGRAAEPRFSRHALRRVQQRGIQLDQPTLGRLQEGVQRAASKGSRESVVFVDGIAYVVSVSNNTVITAVGSEHMHKQVFTNIDSAVIA